jgi:protein SCO1/2
MNTMRRCLTLLALAVAPLSAGAADPHAHHHHGHHELPKAAEPVKGESLYQLQAKLTDQDGKTMQLADFRGSPTVIAMFYASCTSVCPLIVSDIQRLEKAAGRDDLRILLVSLDGSRDTPKALKDLAARHRIDETKWRLASTSDESAQEIAAVLGVRYKRMDDGNISHSALVTLLDREGVIQGRVEGVMQPMDDLAARVKALPAKEK